MFFYDVSLYQWQPVTTVVSVSNTDTSFFSSLGHVFQHSSISLLILHYNTETTRIYLFFCELQRYRVNILFFFFSIIRIKFECEIFFFNHTKSHENLFSFFTLIYIYIYIFALKHLYIRRNEFLWFFFKQKHIRASTLPFSLSLALSLLLSLSLSLSLILPHFLTFQSKLTNFYFLSFSPFHSILYKLSYWLFMMLAFVSFTRCTTLTITESKGLWQARAAAADERTSRDSRAFSLGYHPVQAPRSARPWKAGGRAAGKRGRRYIRSPTGERGNEWG